MINVASVSIQITQQLFFSRSLAILLLFAYMHVGSYVPDSHFFKHMSIASVEVILIAVLMATGLLIATVLLVFNIIWRNHK
jgi:hypothetical protein